MIEDASGMQVLEVKTSDGHRFSAFIHAPETIAGAPILLSLPAMGVKANYYHPLAEQFANRGCIFIRTDLRGHGSSSIRPNRNVNFGYHEIVCVDLPELIQTIQRTFPGHPLYLIGHSLGGQLAMLYCGLNADSISGLILIASGSVYYKHFNRSRRLTTLLFTQSVRLLAAALGSFPGHKIGFAAHESYGVVRDWAYQARTGHYQLNGAHKKIEAAIAKAKFNALVISIEADELAPPASVEHLCSKIPSATIKRWHYIPPNDLKDKIDHLKWVKHNSEIVDYVSTWLSSAKE